MTLAQICLLVAALLPLACAWTAKAGAFQLKDNREPRAWLASQTGFRARANAAQANGFEALPLFLAGLFVASQHGATQGTVDAAALTFVGARLAYIALYLLDQAALRSLAWLVGVAASVFLFFA
jgi:uncharacterized MAPEG superfamily protein